MEFIPQRGQLVEVAVCRGVTVPLQKVTPEPTQVSLPRPQQPHGLSAGGAEPSWTRWKLESEFKPGDRWEVNTDASMWMLGGLSFQKGCMSGRGKFGVDKSILAVVRSLHSEPPCEADLQGASKEEAGRRGAA